MPAHYPKSQDPPPAPRAPGTHRKGADPLCPFRRSDAKRWGVKAQQRKRNDASALFSLLSSAENGEEGSNSVHPATERPNLPRHRTQGGHVPPFATPTHSNAEAYAKPPAAKHTLTCAHAMSRLGRVLILHALGVAGGCCRAHTRHKHHLRKHAGREQMNTKHDAFLHRGDIPKNHSTPPSPHHPHPGQHTGTQGRHHKEENGEKEREIARGRCEHRRQCPIGHHP